MSCEHEDLGFATKEDEQQTLLARALAVVDDVTQHWEGRPIQTPERVANALACDLGEAIDALEVAKTAEAQQPTDEQQREAEAEVTDLMARLLLAAKDVRGHSPSRRLAHGNCPHCRATVQAAAFIAAMMEDDVSPDAASETCPSPCSECKQTCDLPPSHGGRHGHSGLDGHKWVLAMEPDRP